MDTNKIHEFIYKGEDFQGFQMIGNFLTNGKFYIHEVRVFKNTLCDEEENICNPVFNSEGGLIRFIPLPSSGFYEQENITDIRPIETITTNAFWKYIVGTVCGWY
jgi:hypothetical protein